MDIQCPACQAGFRIPDKKLPTDRESLAFSCPKCAHPITVDLRPEPEDTFEMADPLEAMDPDAAAEETENIFDQAYDATEKPFDFVTGGEKTALICESDPALAEKINQALEEIGFTCAAAESTLSAIKYMRYHTFDLVALNENFDGQAPETNPIRLFLSRLPMATRRLIFVTLVTRQYRTMDSMAAYTLSVNQVIHEKNIDEIGAIIRQGLDDNDAFYLTFRKVQAAINAADAI